MKIRIDEQKWNLLTEALQREPHLETAGILLAEHVETADGPLLIVHSAEVVPESGYTIRKPDQLQIDPVCINRMVRPAREHGWSIVTIHTHGPEHPPAFSWADDRGDARLMPSFSRLIPGVPHGSAVLNSHGGVAVRLFSGDTAPTPAEFVVVGRTLKSLSMTEAAMEEPFFARQRLALGSHGQSIIRRARVGVVGTGGIGSMVAVQLAHLGVGELVLVDGDDLEATNLSRVIGARASDVGRLKKVDIAARYIVESGLPVRVQTSAEHLDIRSVDELAHLDVVFSCVDRHTPRALLNRLAYRRLVPVIDTGTAFRVDETGKLVGDAGRVVVVGPGRCCLRCWGHLNPDALREEALSPEERGALAADGYIQGAMVPQPSVVAFNGMVASAAVVEFMRLLTGFAGADEPPNRLAFSFSNGTVKRNATVGDDGCDICAAHTAK